MKKIFFACLFLLSMQAQATQMAKIPNTRTFGPDTINEELYIYEGRVRDIRIVNRGAPDTLMFTCNKEADALQVAAVFEAWWACQAIFDYVDQVKYFGEEELEEYETNPNNHYLVRAINRCSIAVNCFLKAECKACAQQVMAFKQALVAARDADEMDEQMELVKALNEKYGALRELQHCGNLY